MEKEVKIFNTYLIGAMEQVADNGIGWREKVKLHLKDFKNLNIVDPCENEPEKTGYDVSQAKKKAYGWKRSGEWVKFNEMFDNIIKSDLENVQVSDFLILYIAPEHRLGGTVSELTYAYDRRIPVYCLLEGNISEMNSWVLRLINKHGIIFRTWKDLYEKIEEVLK